MSSRDYFAARYVAQEARKAGGRIIDTAIGVARAVPSAGSPSAVATAGPSGPITLPWPPSGQHQHGHADNRRYLLPHAIAYRDSVAGLLHGRPRITGRYRLHVHLSPPDARERDMDNALKSLFDALVRAEYLPTDSMTHMRELLVTVDDDKLNHVRVEARGIA